MAFPSSYQYGGQSGVESSDGLDFWEGLGRWKNDISGTSANNAFNAAEAEKTRVYNSAEAQKNRDWQTEMSNTAYQRAVADMKAAGINPASLGGDASGSPASTPSGSAASASAASAGSGSSFSLGSMFMGVVKNAISLALFKKFSNSTVTAKEAQEAAKTASSIEKSFGYYDKEGNKHYSRFEESYSNGSSNSSMNSNSVSRRIRN